MRVLFFGGVGGWRGMSKSIWIKSYIPTLFVAFTLKTINHLSLLVLFSQSTGAYELFFFSQTSTYSYVNVKIIYEKTKDKTLLDILLPTTLRQSLLEYNIAVRWIIMYFAGSCKFQEVTFNRNCKTFLFY